MGLFVKYKLNGRNSGQSASPEFTARKPDEAGPFSFRATATGAASLQTVRPG
jgi:hypothetical protein